MKGPTLIHCFLLTLKDCATNLSCAPFFMLAIAFYALYYCWPYEAQLPEHIDAAIVDEDGTPLSRAVAQALMASADYRVVMLTRNRATAEAEMKKGKIFSIIGIPPQFEENALNGLPTALTLITNGAFLVVARSEIMGATSVLEEAATAAIMAHFYMAGAPLGELAAKMERKRPAVVVQAMYNTISGYLSFAVAIVFVIIFQSIIICGIAMLLNDWFGRNPYPAPLAMALSDPLYLLALQGAPMLICLVWILAVEGYAFAWQGINSFQNIPATFATGLFFAWAVTSAGMLVGMLFRTSHFAIHAVVTSSLPCVFISGNLFPWQDIPIYMRALAWILPSTPGVDAMLRSSQAGASVIEIFPYLLHLLFLGLLYFGLAWFVASRQGRQEKNQEGASGMETQALVK